MKTIKQWLETIEDKEIRKKALANMDLTADSLEEALSMAFTWKDTPEGEDYWMEVYKNL